MAPDPLFHECYSWLGWTFLEWVGGVINPLRHRELGTVYVRTSVKSSVFRKYLNVSFTPTGKDLALLLSFLLLLLLESPYIIESIFQKWLLNSPYVFPYLYVAKYFVWEGRKESVTGIIFLRFILFIFRERGREGEREGEKHQSIASCTPRTEDLACNPGVCPDWNCIGNLLVCGLMPKPLSHTSQSMTGYFVLCTLLRKIYLFF